MYLSIASCQWPVAAAAAAESTAAAHPSLPHDCVRTALSSFPLSNVHSYSMLVRCSLQAAAAAAAAASAASQPAFIGVVACACCDLSDCQQQTTTAANKINYFPTYMRNSCTYTHTRIRTSIQPSSINVHMLLYPVRNAPDSLSLRMLAFIHTLNVCTLVVVSVTFVFVFAFRSFVLPSAAFVSALASFALCRMIRCCRCCCCLFFTYPIRRCRRRRRV